MLCTRTFTIEVKSSTFSETKLESYDRQDACLGIKRITDRQNCLRHASVSSAVAANIEFIHSANRQSTKAVY